MFGFFKKKNPPPESPIRALLFGDSPFAAWCLDKPESEPWASFSDAKASLDRADRDGAIAKLRKILGTRGLESRHYLQAWHFLRAMGVRPGLAEAREVLGVVVEVAMPEGLDLVAAYSDLSARYYNFSGAAVVWEHPDDSLDPQIRDVLVAGSTIAAAIGPCEGPRPAPPPRGQARLNILTPLGLMFGQAPMEALAGDPMAGRLLSSATELMLKLIEKTKSAGNV